MTSQTFRLEAARAPTGRFGSTFWFVAYNGKDREFSTLGEAAEVAAELNSKSSDITYAAR